MPSHDQPTHEETKSYDEVDALQVTLEEAGLGHWKVTPMNGVHGDHRAYFRAERPTPNGKAEVTHREARVLVRLASEKDALLASTNPPPVASGSADTSTYGSRS
jgi:hypothetical protein